MANRIVDVGEAGKAIFELEELFKKKGAVGFNHTQTLGLAQNYDSQKPFDSSVYSIQIQLSDVEKTTVQMQLSDVEKATVQKLLVSIKMVIGNSKHTAKACDIANMLNAGEEVDFSIVNCLLELM